MVSDTAQPLGKRLNWQGSLLWLALAVACFHAAYSSIHRPAAGWLIFGYAFALVRLTHQPTVRRAFYFGLAAGCLCYAPQLFFFWRIFNAAAVVLWLILAFWIGLFTAMVWGVTRRWGRAKAIWLTPFIWTGIEYFRSELYYLKFSWLNVGFALANASYNPFTIYGMYGVGFLVFALAAWASAYPNQVRKRGTVWRLALALGLVWLSACWLESGAAAQSHRSAPPLKLVGVQMEFPPANIIPKVLDHAFAKNTNAALFVLSEYTLEGPVPEALKEWCREHARFLVVGGKEPLGATNYYNTAFVVGTNGEIVFQQAKSVPIQFFKDGRPAPEQKVWDSPWGKIGICICYDLSYRRVTDALIKQGAQLLIVPTMDVEEWGQHQHELHARVAWERAAEYGVPIFRVASSGISQAVNQGGHPLAQTRFSGSGDVLAAELMLPTQGVLPLDAYLAPACVAVTAMTLALLLVLARQPRARLEK